MEIFSETQCRLATCHVTVDSSRSCIVSGSCSIAAQLRQCRWHTLPSLDTAALESSSRMAMLHTDDTNCDHCTKAKIINWRMENKFKGNWTTMTTTKIEINSQNFCKTDLMNTACENQYQKFRKSCIILL